MEAFLQATEIVNWNEPSVPIQARELSAGARELEDMKQRCFEWVRNTIQHSSDFCRNPATCSALEVPAEGTGYCDAKSCLLAALRQANGTPAGFCCQRLGIDETGEPYSLHGFNAVPLAKYGWYRIDARGNKPGVDAQFALPVEKLTFRLALPQEGLFSEILADLPSVAVNALRRYESWHGMDRRLPGREAPSLPHA